MQHLDEISGIKTVPKVFVGMKCIGGNDELQQSWKKRVLYDWLKKEQISFKETSETMDAATGKDAGSKDTKVNDKKSDKKTDNKTDGKKKKNKEDTTTTSSADDAGHKDTSKKKNDSQVGNKSGSQVDKKKKNKEDTTTTSSADDAKHKDTSKKKNDSQAGNKGAKVGGAQSNQKGASGTEDEGPLSHLGVKQFQSPEGPHKNTKEHAEEKLGASSKQEGRVGTRQTDQPKKGMGLDTGKDNKDHFAASGIDKEASRPREKGGAGTQNPAEKRGDVASDHPLGLKRGVYPDDQTRVGDKHPNKVGTHKGDMNEPTNETGKEGAKRTVAGNHGVDIGKGQSADHRVNYGNAQENKKQK